MNIKDEDPLLVEVLKKKYLPKSVEIKVERISHLVHKMHIVWYPFGDTRKVETTRLFDPIATSKEPEAWAGHIVKEIKDRLSIEVIKNFTDWPKDE